MSLPRWRVSRSVAALSSLRGDLFCAGHIVGGSRLVISTVGAPVDDALDRNGEAIADEALAWSGHRFVLKDAHL